MGKFQRKKACSRNFFNFFLSIRYHGSSSSIKCHVYHHVGGRRHTPVACNESREPHTSHYTSRPVTKKNNQQTTQTSHYTVDRWNFFLSCFDIKVKKNRLYVINFFERIIRSFAIFLQEY